MNRLVLILVSTVIVAGWMIASTMDMAMAEGDDRFYCDMVAKYDASGGEHGWPAYKGYDQCD